VVAELSLARSVGFATTSVKVWTLPSLKVERNVEVIWRGANEVVCPRLSVVWTNTVLEKVELDSCHDYGDAWQGMKWNTYLALGVVDVVVLEVLEVEILEVLVGVEEVVEITVEGVAVEEVWGVVVVEGVCEVLCRVLTGELVGDGDWEVDGVSDVAGEELGGAELAVEVATDAEDVCWVVGGLECHSKD
jgi:hypothetical protein